MDLRDVFTLWRSVQRSVRYLLDGRVRFPQDRLGDVLETPDGETFIVYRETVLRPAVVDPPDDGVVLVFRMQVAGRETGETLREVLFDPLANVATPFFAGMPGFRRKLWLAGERPGEFLELYEWASAEDANRFVAVLQSLLDPFDFAGSASFEVVADDSVDEYVAARSVAWRDATTPQPGRDRQQRSIGVALLVASALFVAGYLAWRRSSRTEPAATRETEEQA